ncbi:gem-associated protein 2-like [Stegodyphus dumicola]|uniref:gem-associated protein 2-like n=1 Tax=Stegodyphus dumicola TaxID=202533 RepID=UPI0015AF9AB4|nr:gem-associated protein 2-like [Stegodyphus dumicola]
MDNYSESLSDFLIDDPELLAELTSSESDFDVLIPLMDQCIERNVINETNRPLQVSDSTRDGFIVVKPEFAVTKEVQNAHLDLFVRRKTRLSEDRALLKKKFPRRSFPKIHQKNEWRTYCLGKLDKDTAAVLKPELHDACEPRAENREWRLELKGNPPLLSVVIHLKQPAVIQLLQYQKDWLKKGAYTHDNGLWIYALLACLEKPIHPDTGAILHSISRLCSSFKAKIKDPASDMLKSSLNMIISIIDCCFNQQNMPNDFVLGE